MYELNCINMKTNKRFAKVFYSYHEMILFKRKCKYSKRVIITSIVKYY